MLEWLGEVMKLTLFENVLQSLVQGRDKDKLSAKLWALPAEVSFGVNSKKIELSLVSKLILMKQ